MAEASKRNRVMNRSRVLRTLWSQPLLSRVEIASILGLDKSTISSVVNELMQLGILQEVAHGDASPQGGRRPVQLHIRHDYGYVLGLELQPGFFRAALCDLQGRVVQEWCEERIREEQPFAQFLLDILNEILTDIGEYRRSLLGVGVAMGGLINSVRNEVTGSIPMRIQSFDFHTEISRHFEFPVVTENDANACAWGELTFHRSRNVHDFLYVLVQMRSSAEGKYLYGGIGVGLGIVINGTLYPGANFTAGEFRSTYWDNQGSGQFSLNDEEAAQVYHDTAMRQRFFRELARNVALIVNVMNLDHLFVGGDVLSWQEEIQPIFNEEIQRAWPYESEPGCEVSFSSFGENAVVYGAAGMMLDRLFSDQIFPLGDIRNRHGRSEVLSEFNEAIIRLGER